MTARDTFDLTLTRTIRAPRAKVFDAFVNPDQLRRWFGPRGHAVAEATVDAKIGGRYRLVMQPMAGKTFAVGGVYREIASPSRLVFTWKWEGEEMGAMGETLVTVTLDERRGEHGVETEVRLQHSGFPAPEARAAHNDGWGSTLNRLVDMVDPRGSAATVTVFGNPRSTYVRSVRMALAEKGVAYSHEPVAPHSVEVLALNPFGRVPAFRDGEFTLYETSAILRYIEESFPGPSLLAGNARLRATMEQWVSLINCHAYDAMVRRYVLQYVFPKGANGAPDRAVIDCGRAADQGPSRRPGSGLRNARSACGQHRHMADLLLAPIVFYLGMFPEGKTLLAGAPNVTRAYAWMAERPSFKATIPALS